MQTSRERRRAAIDQTTERAARAVALVASWDVGYALASRDNLHAYVIDLTAAIEAREDMRHAHNS
jgi:hypothetical protein